MNGEIALLAALLVAGHALADFVFQTDWMIRNKVRVAGLAAHGSVVAVCHAATLLPFGAAPILPVVAAITAAHVLIDLVKTAASNRTRRYELEWFAVDQLAHIGSLALAWSWLAPRVTLLESLTPSVAILHHVAVMTAAVAFNVNGMSSIVAAVLRRCRIAPSDVGPPAGRVIGILERIFALTLILLDQWEALGFLVAAKSLARFKDLDQRPRAEYYLVGTLTSLLGATVSALAVRAWLRP